MKGINILTGKLQHVPSKKEIKEIKKRKSLEKRREKKREQAEEAEEKKLQAKSDKYTEKINSSPMIPCKKPQQKFSSGS